MWRSSRAFWFLFLVVSLSVHIPGHAQQDDCTTRLEGRVVDRSTGEQLMYANLYIRETGRGTATDSNGYFVMDDVCTGSFHIRVSHLGCETTERHIAVHRDTFIVFELHHHDELLDELVIHGSSEDRTVQISTTISREGITSSGSEDLSDILGDVIGVSTLRSGSGISKPVIHGVYGNRVSILNNGVVQAGQQWGNDHAPEIDPFVAEHISVVKGVSALAYGGNSLGSLVLVEPGPIPDDPHLHGEANYIFSSNGIGQTVNAELWKHSKWAAWKVIGTGKVSGDRRSADYYLTNTGKREYNAAAQLERKFKDSWKIQAYYSFFFTQIGILRGSHISNITDLEAALERGVPFFTNDYFSYAINAPSQRVAHHLGKMEAAWVAGERLSFKMQYSGQLNKREEYDVRRSGRSDLPALSLQLMSHAVEGRLSAAFDNDGVLKTGVLYEYQYNQNNPETGILPLIPDYTENGIGWFVIWQQHIGRVFYEFGARYDLTFLEAITISQTLPREIIRYDHVFSNYTVSGGIRLPLHERFSLNVDIGSTQRFPEVNELYSAGLHQGVSGIEEGNPDLDKETSFKAVLSAKLNFREMVYLEALGYFQYIADYIYLEPQEELRLTIRGAFPVYNYEQTDATISGTDLLLSVIPAEPVKLLFKYSLVRGRDRIAASPLINIPSDNLSAGISCYVRDGRRLTDNVLKLTGEYVFEQKNAPAEQYDDIVVEAPDGYFLLGFSASTKLQLKDSHLAFRLTIDNMLNTSYRDYLNRQRYFADDLGINVRLGFSYGF